jgi:hypothetical protein
MKRFMLLAAALSVAAGSFAQGGPPPDAVARGNGNVSDQTISGRFDLMAAKFGDKLVGALHFMQMVKKGDKPIVVDLNTITAFDVDTTTLIATIEGTGKLNGVAAKISVTAQDLAHPGSPTDVLDTLAINAAAEDGTTFTLAGVVKPGDIVVQGPPPPPPPPPTTNNVCGRGTIQVSDTVMGTLDIQAVLTTASDGTTRINGKFMYQENTKGQKKPINMVQSKKITALSFASNVATLTADVNYNGKPATATLVVTDNRKPTDPADVVADTFELHVLVGGAEVFVAKGSLVMGDLVVK